MVQNIHLWAKKLLRPNIIFLLLLLLLAACGGSDEAAEDAGESDTSTIDDSSDSEAIDEENFEATGSEDDSDEIPPTPEPGSKVDAPRTTPNPVNIDLIAANPTAPADRTETGETAVSRPLDFVLLIDATGSMANEIAHLQAGLPMLSTNLATLSETNDLRLGLIAYRDEGKLDTFQFFNFTEDPDLFVNQIASLTAVGGGDYPEALNEGLQHAINELNWRTDATNLLILIGDAPPNVNGAENSNLTELQNIILFTIGSDGLDSAGVSFFQQVAQRGNGRFYFISDNAKNNGNVETAVFPSNQLPIILLEIVQEVLNAQAP